MMNTTIEHKGNSGKRWTAIWATNGKPVRTASGEDTIFRGEAHEFERQYPIILTGVQNG